MFRILLLLSALPSSAAADWIPRSSMFTYEATFDTCLREANAPDIVDTCDALLTAAYVLKRAVARGVYTCGASDLRTCALPFEDEGLPHIAVRIALDAGCDATQFDADTSFFHPNHCVTVASNIMIDEGVVPVNTERSCEPQWGPWSDCSDLVMLQTQLWEDAILDISGNDPLIFDLIDRNGTECAAALADITDIAEGYMQGSACISAENAKLWADLARNQDNN